MLQLTEEQLAGQGVTKGARHKLALSIAKLQQRYNTLLNLEKDLLQPTRDSTQSTSFSQGSALLINTVDELKAILATPMKPSQENDLQDIPAQFTKVLGKREYNYLSGSSKILVNLPRRGRKNFICFLVPQCAAGWLWRLWMMVFYVHVSIFWKKYYSTIALRRVRRRKYNSGAAGSAIRDQPRSKPITSDRKYPIKI